MTFILMDIPLITGNNMKMITDKKKITVDGFVFYYWANHYERVIYAKNNQTKEVKVIGKTGSIFNQTGIIKAIKTYF